MSRRKQARPIRHLDQESSEEEGKVKGVGGGDGGKKKIKCERKIVDSGGEDVEEERASGEEDDRGERRKGEPDGDEDNDKRNKTAANGLLPRVRRPRSAVTTHHHSRVFHHHNSKFHSDEDEEDEKAADEMPRRMQIDERRIIKEKIKAKKIKTGEGEQAKENFLGTGAHRGSRGRESRDSRGKDEEVSDAMVVESEDANNNTAADEGAATRVQEDADEKCVDGLGTAEQQTALKESMTAAIQHLIGTWPTTLSCGIPPNSDAIPNVTLEALQDTKDAMAQFAANALNAVNNREPTDDDSKPTAIQDLALLQSTLMTLRQQQLFQLRVIQQLQQQLEHDGPEVEDTPQKRPLPGGNSRDQKLRPAKQPRQSVSSPPKSDSPRVQSKNPSNQVTQKDKPEENGDKKSSMCALSPHFASLLNCANQDPNRPLSPGLPPPHLMMSMGMHEGREGMQQSRQTGSSGGMPGNCENENDPMMMMSNMLLPPPPVNTLEVLQKRAQEVLDSASQGLLASSLAADDPRKKGLGYDKSREPFFKHRCRYCGKVFGSDSALQIHIRSHTGERPFKCNVCGSRFTTKGNLKVHFQRHAAKFPHIKMNPHPVPEQFDHLHPPLLAAGQTSPPDLSPTLHAPPPPHSFMFSHHPFHSITGGPAPAPPPPPPPPPQTQTQQQQRDTQRESSMSALLRFDMISKYESSEKPGINTPEDLSKKEQAEELQPEPTRVRPEAPRFGDEDEDEEQDEDDDEEDTQEMRAGHRIPQEQLVRNMMMMMMRDKPKEQEHSFDDCEPQNLSSMPGRESPLYEQNDEENLIVRRNIERMNEMVRKAEFRGGSEERTTRGGSIGKQHTTISHAHAPDRPHSASTFLRSQSQDLRLLLPSSATSSPTTSSPSYSSSHENSPSKHSPSQPQNSDITKDPAIYTNLLPRPGSNDNAWESLIEVTKTSETSKLQQLVDNIEHKLTDPNQCIICHRVLSCKSALQMHYRTHTGERPFKCKICGRAFTTKGNLKTHMGVHRAKPPLRVLHQCPVCHKRFTNSLVLQQHIRLHTGEPTDLTPDQIRAAEVKDHFLLTPSSTSSTPSPHSYPPGFHPPPTQTPPSSTPLPPQLFGSPNSNPQFFAAAAAAAAAQAKDDAMSLESDTELSDTDDKSIASNHTPSMLPFSTSLAALENQVKTITTLANNQNMMMMMMADKQRQIPEDLSKRMFDDEDSEEEDFGKKTSESPVETKQALDLTGGQTKSIASSTPPPRPQSTSPPPVPSSQQLPHFLPHPGMLLPAGPPGPPPFNLAFNSPLLIPPPPPPPPGSAAAAAVAAAMERARLGENQCFLWTTAGPGAIARGNTTCSICLKTFACNSALEIHYRSHTKERPFKCTVCDRGFSTKGNMKQHMLTHKIRDMPSSSSSTSSHGSNVHRSALDSTPTHNCGDSGGSVINDDDEDEDSRDNTRSPFSGNGSFRQQETLHEEQEVDEENKEQEQHLSSEDEHSSPPHHPNTRSHAAALTQAQSESPPSPLPPPNHHHHVHHHHASPSTSSSGDGSSKHVCKVCNKNFSSTSALQIHMRTHTGDRPFVCSVCQKAFTTKGNLKVHMGTHMWTNGASRRGRRMSLDMPLGLAAAVAAAAQGTGPPPPHHHAFFHHPGFPPPPPPPSLQHHMKSKDDGGRSSQALQALSLYHAAVNPFGTQPNPSSSSPLLFLNGSLQKPDLVQGFAARSGSSISPILQHQASGCSSAAAKSSPNSSTSDRKDDSPADRNNASSPEGKRKEESPKEQYFEQNTSPDTSNAAAHKKLEMMIKHEANDEHKNTHFDEDEEPTQQHVVNDDDDDGDELH